MSWITIVWSMNAAACLTLAAIYLFVWCKQRKSWRPFGIFDLRCGGGCYRGVRASDDACRDSRTIRSTRSLDTCARLGAHCRVRSFRAALSPRRATVARVEHLWPADTGADSQFHFDAESYFRRITRLRHFSWWGSEMISMPIGVANPWGFLVW